MDLPQLLLDAKAFREADAAELSRSLDRLAEALGEAWALVRSDANQGPSKLAHRLTGLDFVAVAGGSFDLGLSSDDIAEAAEYLDFGSEVAARLASLQARAEPVHRVTVHPFLCSERLLDAQTIAALSAGKLARPTVSRASARDLASALGLRLASEAELEWVARDGGKTRFTLDAARDRERIANDDRRLRSCFGLREMNEGTWAEDDWHPSYEGAPSDSRPWFDGSVEGVVRGGFWLMAMQSDEELLDALAAVRYRGVQTARVRLVFPFGELGQLPADTRTQG